VVSASNALTHRMVPRILSETAVGRHKFNLFRQNLFHQKALASVAGGLLVPSALQ
jgi:hypothetical protein